jgi:hypothetical protein
VHRHLLVKQAKMDRKEVAAMDDTAARLALLRHWVLELRPIAEKRAAASSKPPRPTDWKAVGLAVLPTYQAWLPR